MSNPLLHIEGLPPFSQIKPEHIQPAIQKLIEENRQAIEQVFIGSGRTLCDRVLLFRVFFQIEELDRFPRCVL